MDSLRYLVITQHLLKAIAEIDEFKGRWDSLRNLAPERLSALRRIATIESVGSSTRIEGVRLTDDEVERLLSGIAIGSFRSRDEEEVAGYAELMELIFESYNEITLTENHIKQLHGVLLRHSSKDQRHRGGYKKLPNHVEAFDQHGQSLGVVFATATPFDTPRQMQKLVSWTGSALGAGEYHPLIVIGVFVVRFLAIHPFQDGNGRLSRALATLLLLRDGYSYVAYSSFERIVEESKEEYYIALRRGQATLDQDDSQLIDWVSFIIDCLVRQKKKRLTRKIERERLMSPLSPLSESLLGIVREHGRVTVQQAAAATAANRNTIKDHLGRLVRSGHLTKRGCSCGTWYERG